MDSINRFIFENKPIRGELIQLQTSFQAIIEQHPYPQHIRKLLGESLCIAGLLCAIIKFKGRISVQFRGEGKLKFLLAQCDNHFNLRGLAKFEEDLSEKEMMESLNQGVIVIMLDPVSHQNRYQGIVSWQGNSMAESIEKYFQSSEQLKTKIWLAVDEKSAAGLLLQTIPAEDELTQEQDPKIYWQPFQNKYLDHGRLLNQEPAPMLQNFFPDDEIRLFPSVAVQFKCTCSRKKGEEAILFLGKEEALAELAENHALMVTCDFCQQSYHFDAVDVAKIFSDDNDAPGKTLH